MARRGVKDDVLSEKRADTFCRVYADGFDGILQTVGIMITAISAVVLKAVSSVMLFATVLLLVFGLFTWGRTLVVAVICASMFWLPEGMSLIVLALGVLQGKVMDIVDTLACR